MKKLFKSFLFTLLCICLLIPFTGCAEKRFDGIVSGIEINEEHPILTYVFLNDKTEYEKYYFPALCIFDVDFETYNCKNFEELLRNENFIKNKSHEHLGYYRQWFSSAYSGKITITKDDTNFYVIFYEGFEVNVMDNVAPEEWDAYVDAFFNNLDYTTYIGWAKL